MTILRKYLSGTIIEVVDNNLIINWTNVKDKTNLIYWDKESIPLLLADIINKCNINLCDLTQLVKETNNDFSTKEN